MRNSTRQQITGTVISDKMDKTVVVQVETVKPHPQYKKYIKRRKNYKAHDEKNECRLGDVVLCMGTRPLSADKRWRVVEIVRRKFVSTAEIVETDEMIMKKDRKQPKKSEEAAEAPEAAVAADAEQTEASAGNEAE